MLFSCEEKKKRIEEELISLIKMDSRFFTSADVIKKIQILGKYQEILPIFLRQLEVLCDSVFSLEFDDCRLSEQLFSEYNTDRELLFEIAVCIRNQIDSFLTSREICINQKLILIKRIAFKAE